MKIIRNIILLLIFITAINCSKSQNNITWISQITGISFPDNSVNIETYDNGEFYVTFYLELPKNNIKEFIKKYKFQKINNHVSMNYIPPFINLLGIEHLTHNKLPSENNLLYYQNRSDANEWVLLLEKETGNLWGEIIYPDPGGTNP
ncbi:MAG: hypothetical protein KJ915_02145 [Candidatus Omnitrophica bacterium]|nr:hypothetical protein [Candidatus Omnitrophota bacterium]